MINSLRRSSFLSIHRDDSERYHVEFNVKMKQKKVMFLPHWSCLNLSNIISEAYTWPILDVVIEIIFSQVHFYPTQGRV